MGYIYRRKKQLPDGSLVETGPYWIKYYRNGIPQRESSNSLKERDAKELLAMREGDLARGIPVNPMSSRIKIDELLQDLISDYRVNHRSSLELVELRCRVHLCPWFGGRRASRITTADVNRYIEHRQKEGAANATINRELAALKRAYNLAVTATPPKLYAKPHIPMLQEDNVRQGFLEPAQYESILRHLPEPVKPIITFAYITSWRTASEVLAIEWRHIDFQAGTIRIEPGIAKNGEGRLFPMTSELRAMLEQQRAKTDALAKEGIICPWVFSRNGRQIRSIRTAWGNACAKAGCPAMHIHDCRRSAVRSFERAGIARSVAMKLSGHKTESVYRRYAIVSEKDLRDAASKLENTPVKKNLSDSGTD